MILGLYLTIFIYVVAAAVFRLILPLSRQAAQVFLVLLGGILLYVAGPLLAIYVAAQLLLTVAILGLCRLFPRYANIMSWFVFLGLLPTVVAHASVGTPFSASVDAAVWMPQFGNVGWSVGSAFFVIRSFVSLREGLQAKRMDWLAMLAGLTFLPAFSAGPIFGTRPFQADQIAASLKVRDIAQAVMRLGWGAAAFYVIAPHIRGLTGHTSGVANIADMYLNLVALYFDFSGYTSMAIAFGAFFGVTLPENFNRPYLALSIREFWQRWHMSLSWFVSTYLFRPFVRLYGKPRLGIFIAFTAVGLWHELSLGYLLWGVGHGAALSLAMKPPAPWRWLMATLPRWAGAALCWFLTVTWVALVSLIANRV